MLLVVPRIPLGFTRRVVAQHVGQDVAAERGRRFRLRPERAVSAEDVGADGGVRGVHAPGGAERVVGVERARRLAGDVGVVELVDRDVREADPRHARLRPRGQLEPRRDPRSVRGAERRDVDVVLPLVPLRFFGCANALRVHDQQARRDHRSVAQLGDDREVVRAPHAVDRHVAGDARREHVTDAAELRLADHHVVEAALEIEARGRERIGVRPREARVAVARGLPRVAEHDVRHRRRGAAR